MWKCLLVLLPWVTKVWKYIIGLQKLPASFLHAVQLDQLQLSRAKVDYFHMLQTILQLWTARCNAATGMY